jgi:hypothetical protein
MSKIIVVALLLLLSGCSLCRDKAVQDAENYQALGRETRIAAYCVGADGYALGLGLWSSHVQAQVLEGSTWMWAAEFGGTCGHADIFHAPYGD